MSRRRVVAGFLLLGLINNLLFVVILSAALDLVGAKLPKSIVLLADILPSAIVKSTAPYLFDRISYSVRVIGCIFLSFIGMQSIALSSGLYPKLLGIILASASSGAGEITFLQLTHYYPSISVASWASGTGAAGLVGGLLYVASTTWFRISVTTTLLATSMMPGFLALAYFIILPPLQKADSAKYNTLLSDDQHTSTSINTDEDSKTDLTLVEKAKKAKPLVFPYMLPLFLVYFAEYTINQGISPTLLFPISEMPFSRYRDVYPTYMTIYQTGVFMSRSSSSWIRVRNLLLPTAIQCFLALFLATQSILYFIPHVSFIFLIILLEGICGGLVYVNAFHQIGEDESIKHEDREFSIGAVGVADSLGILGAAVLSLWLEGALCRINTGHGRPWCSME